MNASSVRPPGIYFGLPEAEYHADSALGSSDIRTLLQSPADYWWHSAMNPHRPEDEDTPSKLFGRALHALVLEGKDAFKHKFCAEPDKREHPTALVTVAQIEAFLAEKEAKPKGKQKKEDLEAAARPLGALLWTDLMRQAAIDAQDRTQLKSRMFGDVIMAGGQIASNEELREAFRNGRPEVSVFWEMDGIRLKARFDYLKVRQVVDLKSFRNPLAWPVDKVIAGAIANRRYDVQAAHYLLARARLRDHIGTGALYGPVPTQSWLDALACETQFEHWLVFYQAEGAPIVLKRRFKPQTPVITSAEADIATALQSYRDHMERYGTSMWPFVDSLIDPDVDFDMLPRWFQPELVA